jgi:hypothetical protein
MAEKIEKKCRACNGESPRESGYCRGCECVSRACQDKRAQNSELCARCGERVYPTTWKSTDPKGDPKGRSYMARTEDDMPPPDMGQRVTAVIGKVEASVPHLPYEKWIGPCGTVKAVPMYTARHVRPGQNWREEPYYQQIRRDLLRSGHVSYETGEPHHYQNHEAWLAKREGMIAERRADQTREMQEAELKHQAELDAKAVQLGAIMERAMARAQAK